MLAFKFHAWLDAFVYLENTHMAPGCIIGRRQRYASDNGLLGKNLAADVVVAFVDLGNQIP